MSSDDQKSWKRRIEVRMHLMICHRCSKYAKQLEHIASGFKQFFTLKAKDPDSSEIKKIEQEVLRKVKRER
ncbi:MAG: hypothetical protein COT73_03155 [Bdellovibrio sp. CG10_big_fil_rev_8_21_14_0_10_47_8]|nr:MAG: hypothetical protein COT73_03155 [Bdellovibrio sp. CG10_big_fil_rev_8_21_14_0_10_47_8]